MKRIKKIDKKISAVLLTTGTFLTLLGIYNLNVNSKTVIKSEQQLIEKIKTNNILDNFDCKMIKFEDNSVNFVGKRTTKQTTDIGEFSYTISSLNEYKNISNALKNDSYNGVILNQSTPFLTDLGHLVDNATAQWTTFTAEQIKQHDQLFLDICQYVLSNVNTEEFSK